MNPFLKMLTLDVSVKCNISLTLYSVAKATLDLALSVCLFVCQPAATAIYWEIFVILYPSFRDL